MTQPIDKGWYNLFNKLFRKVDINERKEDIRQNTLNLIIEEIPDLILIGDSILSKQICPECDHFAVYIGSNAHLFNEPLKTEKCLSCRTDTDEKNIRYYLFK